MLLLLPQVRFCGYRRADGTILGDPAEADFTDMLQTECGWVPPPEEKRTAFDLLPWLIQPDPTKKPELYAVPHLYAYIVPILHPDYPQFGELKLKWCARCPHALIPSTPALMPPHPIQSGYDSIIK